MFCGNCGKQIPDQSAFCPECGSAVMQKDSSVNGKSVDHKKVGIIAVVAAVLLVFLLGSFLFGGRSEKKVIDQYVKAACKVDSKMYWKLIPKDIQKVTLDQAQDYFNIYSEDEFIVYLDGRLEQMVEAIDESLGDGWKYSYEVTEEENYSKNDVFDFVQDYREMGVTNFKADAVKSVGIELSFESKDGTRTKEKSIHITLVKIGRSWYLGEAY